MHQPTESDCQLWQRMVKSYTSDSVKRERGNKLKCGGGICVNSGSSQGQMRGSERSLGRQGRPSPTGETFCSNPERPKGRPSSSLSKDIRSGGQRGFVRSFSLSLSLLPFSPSVTITIMLLLLSSINYICIFCSSSSSSPIWREAEATKNPRIWTDRSMRLILHHPCPLSPFHFFRYILVAAALARVPVSSLS